MIAGLVLAAGESSRMGTDKALLAFRGRTFLETVVETLRQTGIERIAVVLGHHAREILEKVKLPGAEVVVNPDYRRGQTSSLQVGLTALETLELAAVVLCLVDYPTVRPETVRKLLEAFQHSEPPVVIPTFHQQRGHPVLIGRALFEELKRLPAAEGASTVIRNARNAMRLVEVDDPGILLDVDDPETYRSLM